MIIFRDKKENIKIKDKRCNIDEGGGHPFFLWGRKNLLIKHQHKVHGKYTNGARRQPKQRPNPSKMTPYS